MTEPTEPTNAATPSPTDASPFFTAPAGELSRFLQLAMAKGGSGDPPFQKVDIAFDGSSIVTEHKDPKNLVALRAEYRGLVGGTPFQCGANAGWLSDYLDGSLFAAEEPVRFEYAQAGGVRNIRLSKGRRSISSGAVKFEDCGRIVLPNGAQPYTNGGTDNGFVTKGPTTPEAGSPWEAFAEKGYVVAVIPKDVLATVLAAGSKLQSHRLKGAEIQFRFPGDGTIGISVFDPKKADEDQFHIEAVEGATVIGNAVETFSVLFQTAIPFLTSIRLLKSPTVTLVHAGGNKPLNIVGVEKDDRGVVRLRVTQNITPNDAALPKK